jgi:hypothetical protein
MARPRRPFSGVEEITPLPDQWMQDEIPGVLGTRKRLRWEASTHWVYTVPNGCYDPMTFLFVLDAVMNIDPDIELRANKLIVYLQNQPYRLTWDVVTVGKVLSDLCDAFSDVLGEKNGLLERGRDWRGVFYRIHRNPATADLAQRLREDLYKATEAEMDARKAGQRPKALVSPLLECPSARGAWVDLS